MPVPISNTFGVKVSKPIDDRFVAADIASRNALLFKYPGLIVYVQSEDTSYELKADLTTWVPLGLYTLEDILDSDNDAGGNPIINAGDAVNPQDLLTLKQGKELAGGRAVIYTPDLLESNPIDVSTVTSNTFLFDGVQLLTKAVFLAAQVDPLENGYWAWVGGVFFKIPITDPIYTFLTAVITPKLGVSNAETLWIVDQLNNNIDPDLISFTWRQIGGSPLGFTPENIANKGIAGGYASLDGSGLVPSAQLPSYVDDVLEFANLAAFPVTGASGKIYIAIDTNFQYRWSGSAYIQLTSASAVWGAISGSLASQTDLITALNLRLLISDISNILTGTATNKALSEAQGKALKDLIDTLTTTVGGKQANITATTSADYYRGDKTFQTLNKAAVGLSNVDNTSDSTKPVSTAQAAADALKMNLSMSARTIKLNKTTSTANGIDGSVNDLMELMAGCTDNTSSGTLVGVSTTNTKAIRFNSTTLIRSFAGGTDGAVLIIQNNTGGILTLTHEDGVETTAANRMLIGQNLGLGHLGTATFIWRATNSRWNLVSSTNSIYNSALAGGSNRLMEVNPVGILSASKTFVNERITDSTNITNLENISNWTAGSYTGTPITGEVSGKIYYGASYKYEMISDTVPKRFMYA